MATFVEIRPKARKDLENIPRKDAERIVLAIQTLGKTGTGDIGKLSSHDPAYRLRVGNWRVLFDFEQDRITIYRIKNRKEAY
jgi:mRNA interferase RelE/StbE